MACTCSWHADSLGEIARTLATLRMARRRDIGNAATIAFQNRRLRDLVEHAYTRVPFYRRKFDAVGLELRHIRTVADLHLIPVTTRAELQQAPLSDIIARGTNPRDLQVYKTSGTTGEPWGVRRTWFENRSLGAFRAQDLATYGIESSDRIVALTRYAPKKRRLQDRMLAAVSRAAGRFTSEGVSFFLPPDELLRQLVRARPNVVAGMATVLAELARFMSESGNPGVAPRIVISGAEVLTPEMARTIGEAFGARVYDKYGANEVGRIASQCPVGPRYHLCGSGVITEVLQHERAVDPGEDGEVIATGLHSFAMPFIRYRLGDTVTAGETGCDCGRDVQTIGHIRGRTHEYLALPDGRRIHVYALRSAFGEMRDKWKKYRLDREAPDRMILRVVTALPPVEDEVAIVTDKARDILGPGVNFRIEFCDALPDVSWNVKEG